MWLHVSFDDDYEPNIEYRNSDGIYNLSGKCNFISLTKNYVHFLDESIKDGKIWPIGKFESEKICGIIIGIIFKAICNPGMPYIFYDDDKDCQVVSFTTYRHGG